MQWTDADRTQRWLTSLPGLATALQGATIKGQAQLTSRWTGGWQSLAEQLQAARAGTAPPADKTPFTLQATLTAPQLDLTLPPGNASTATAVQLQSLRAELAGSLRQATLALDGTLRTGTLQTTLRTRVAGGLASAALWKAQVNELRMQAQDTQRPGPWTLELLQPLALTAQLGQPPATPGTVALQGCGGPGSPYRPAARQRGAAMASHALPGRARHGNALAKPGPFAKACPLHGWMRWGWKARPRWLANRPRPLLVSPGPGGQHGAGGPRNVDAGATLRAQASLRRTNGDLRILTGETRPGHGAAKLWPGHRRGQPHLHHHPAARQPCRRAPGRTDAGGRRRRPARAPALGQRPRR